MKNAQADLELVGRSIEASTTLGAPVPPVSPEASSANVRLVRLVGLLLLLQAVILLGIAIWFGWGIDWELGIEQLAASRAVADAINLGVWFFFLGVGLAPIAIGLIFLRRTAWILAMAFQVLLLTVTLTTYFFSVAPTLERSYGIFLVMASGVVLVFYLNLSGVRSVVQWRDEHLDARAGDNGTD